MKHRLVILLVTAFAALACAKETRETGGDGEPKAGIHFATRLETTADGSVTRGSVINTPALLDGEGGFNVWAFEHSADWSTNPAKSTLMNGILVTSPDNGVTWSYGTEIPWPMDQRVSFFAYAPAGSAATGIAADRTPLIDFTVDDVVADQVDLLIATPMPDQGSTTYLPVTMRFQHALSRIAFSGLMSDPDDTRQITVKSITLNGLYSKGSTLLTDPAVWTVSGDHNAIYTVSIANGMLKDTRLDLTAGIPVELTSADDPDDPDDRYLFLMPQQLARAPGEDPTMDVVLDIDGTEIPYSSLVFSPAAWEPGKSYNYQIVIDGNDLRIIYIDSDVTLGDWTDGIVLQTIPLTSDRDDDAENLFYCMTVLEEINTNSTTTTYQWFGAYAVNDLTHDIVIDVGLLAQDKGLFQSFILDQHLVFDLKKLLRVWGYASPDNPWSVSITNFTDEDWALSDAWQAIDVVKLNIDITQPASTGKYITEVDGVTGATLSATEANIFQKIGGETVEVELSETITNKGSIIIVKKQ